MNRRDFLRASALTVAWLTVPVFPTGRSDGDDYPDFKPDHEYGNMMEYEHGDEKDPERLEYLVRILGNDAKRYLPRNKIYEIRMSPNTMFTMRSDGICWYYNSYIQNLPVGILKKPRLDRVNGYYLIGRSRSRGGGYRPFKKLNES